jgi:hypothetical protein
MNPKKDADASCRTRSGIQKILKIQKSGLRRDDGKTWCWRFYEAISFESAIQKNVYVL